MHPAKLLIPATLAAAISVFSATCGAMPISNPNWSQGHGSALRFFAKQHRQRAKKEGATLVSNCTPSESKGSTARKGRSATRGPSFTRASKPEPSLRTVRPRKTKAASTTIPCSEPTTPVVDNELAGLPNPGSPEILLSVSGPGVFDEIGNLPNANPGSLLPEDIGEAEPDPFNPFELLHPELHLPCVPSIDASCQPGGSPHSSGGGMPGGPATFGIPAPMVASGEPEDFDQDFPFPSQPATVPEPASLGLLGLGLVAIGYQRRKHARS